MDVAEKAIIPVVSSVHLLALKGNISHGICTFQFHFHSSNTFESMELVLGTEVRLFRPD